MHVFEIMAKVCALFFIQKKEEGENASRDNIFNYLKVNWLKLFVLRYARKRLSSQTGFTKSLL